MPNRPSQHPPPRIQIQNVWPQLDCGRFAVKRTVGDRVEVWANVFRDGHEVLGVAIRYKRPGGRWQEAPMHALGNDRWSGSFEVDRCGRWYYRVQAWHDRIASWQDEVRRKVEARQEDLASELSEGAALLGRESVTVEEGLAAEIEDRHEPAESPQLELDVDRPRARERARPGDRARLRDPVLAGPSVAEGAPGVVPAPSGRDAQVRGESAQALPGHPQRRLGLRGLARALGGALRRRPALVRARRAHLSRRQPAHQAGPVLGVAD